MYLVYVLFKIKFEVVYKGWGRNIGESCWFFGNCYCIWEVFVYFFVYLFEGSNCIVVFVFIVNIWDLLIMVMWIIEIEYWCDCINMNVIDMEYFKLI